MNLDTGLDGDIAAQHVVGGAALILLIVLVVSLSISGSSAKDINRS